MIDQSKMTRCQRRSTSAKVFEVSITSRPGAKLFLPASIERSVWEYFCGKAERRGIDLTDVLKREIEINEALK